MKTWLFVHWSVRANGTLRKLIPAVYIVRLFMRSDEIQMRKLAAMAAFAVFSAAFCNFHVRGRAVHTSRAAVHVLACATEYRQETAILQRSAARNGCLDASGNAVPKSFFAH